MGYKRKRSAKIQTAHQQVGGAMHPLIQLWIGLILVVVPVHSFLASYPQRVATKNELRSLPPTLETLVTDTLE